MGVGPAPTGMGIISPASNHLSPSGAHATTRSVSPFGEVEEDAAFQAAGMSGSGLRGDERRTSVDPGRRATAPVGLGTFEEGQPFNAPFAYDARSSSLSRSLLQGSVPDPSRQLKRPAPPVRQDTLGGRLLYVENLPPTMQWQELKDMFRMSGGSVVRADISQAGGQDRAARGYGTVLFASEADAVAAVERFDGWVIGFFPVRTVLIPSQNGLPGPTTPGSTGSNPVRSDSGTDADGTCCPASVPGA